MKIQFRTWNSVGVRDISAPTIDAIPPVGSIVSITLPNEFERHFVVKTLPYIVASAIDCVATVGVMEIDSDSHKIYMASIGL